MWVWASERGDRRQGKGEGYDPGVEVEWMKEDKRDILVREAGSTR